MTAITRARPSRRFFINVVSFFEQRDTRDALDDAVKHLTGLSLTQELIRAATISTADIQSVWFRNRVADMRLAFVGGWKL
jgi:hypothetical protein